VIEYYKNEKDPILSQLYHRSLFFLLAKYKIIKLRSRLSIYNYESYDKVRTINRKLQKLIQISEDG